MKEFELYALGFRCYEQLINVDDMNDLRSCDLRLLDAMNNSSLRMIWTILGCEPMALNAKNSLGLCMTWMNLDHELRTLVLWTTQGYGLYKENNYGSRELRPFDAFESLGVLIIWMILVMCLWLQMPLTTHGCGWHEWLWVMSMNDSGSWA